MFRSEGCPYAYLYDKYYSISFDRNETEEVSIFDKTTHSDQSATDKSKQYLKIISVIIDC